MCTIAHDYFTYLFQMRPNSRERILQAIISSITKDDNCILTTHFIIEEFREAIYSMQDDKSPGPDGYNPRFYQHL